MGIKFSNNASSSITHALTADATSISITPGTGDLFPSIIEGEDYFYATLAGNNGLEIVKVTKRVLDTMTVERAQDNTDALLFDIGDLFELRIVAADFEDTFAKVDSMLEESLEENTSTVNAALANKAPILHSSSSTEYGAGSSTQYGHTKTHDEPDATLTAAAGHAFSPAGAASMQGEIDDKLSTRGGTMTGVLNMNNNPINHTSGIELQGSGYGGYVDFHYDGNAADYTSRIIENTQGHIDITAPNGVGVNGNSVLTSAGGTMNGVIYNPTFMRNNLSGQIELYGGTTGSNGAYIALYGQSCTDGYGNGKVLLRAANKGTTTDVTIDPGVGMYVDGKKVMYLTAEWNDGNGNWYRKYNDGFIIQCVHFSHNNSMPKAISLPIPFKDTNFWAMNSDLYNIHFLIPTSNQTVLFQESITSTMNYTLIAFGY